MKRFLLATIIIASTTTLVWSQTTEELSGAQMLRSMRSIYDQGRLHEIPTPLEAAVKRTGRNEFTKSEKVEAYKILILTYIYLEEPAKADAKMIELLRTDKFFEPAPSDPVEFATLFKKFRSKPVFSVGITAGSNFSQINVIRHYSMWIGAEGKGEYATKPGIQFILFFEKVVKDKIILNPEISYTQNLFSYTNNNISFQDVGDEPSSDNAAYDFAQSRLNLNVIGRYKIGRSKWEPYVGFGPSFGYLINASFSGEVAMGTQLTIPTTTVSENYRTMNYTLIAASGFKRKIGGVYFTGNVRYQYGLHNVVKKENRFNTGDLTTTLQRGGYIDNDFSLNQFQFNFGLVIPYFKPKKLIN